MVAISSSLCASNLICGRKNQQLLHQRFCQDDALTILNLAYSGRCVKFNQIHGGRKKVPVFAKPSKSEEPVPSWAKLDSDEPPPWARNEGEQNESKEGVEVPFFVYLLASAITAIAAVNPLLELVEPIMCSGSDEYLLAGYLATVIGLNLQIGSIFEYVNQNPVFGVLNSDSIFYAPLLGFFAFTGIPTSAFLWYKSVQVANKEAEEQDRRDGYQ